MEKQFSLAVAGVEIPHELVLVQRLKKALKSGKKKLNIINGFEVETDRKKAFDMIAEKAMESATSKVESRSRILMQLYNLASDLETKFKLFCRIIEYVKKANMEHVVGTLVGHVEESMEEWKQMNNNNGSERNVYLEIANLLSGMGGKEEKAMEFMLKYLATFENSESALGESSAAAKDAIASFIRLKTSFSCDLLDYKAIQALKSSNGKVFELLEIFLTKKLNIMKIQA